jgi:hypothetical protein
VPVALICVAVLVFFILRRRRQTRATFGRHGIETTDPDNSHVSASGLIVVETKTPYNTTLGKPELHGDSMTVLKSTPHTAYDTTYKPSAGLASELDSASNFNVPPVVSNEHVSVSYEVESQDARPDGDRHHTHELGVASRAPSLHSDSRTLTSVSEQIERDVYLEKLEAKKAAITEERERLRRMEMLREEDERLEREIEEYKRTKGV